MPLAIALLICATRSRSTGGEAASDLASVAGGVGVALAAGLHCSRLDGSEIEYNRPHPYMPDFVICRSEIREEMLGALRQIW